MTSEVYSYEVDKFGCFFCECCSEPKSLRLPGGEDNRQLQRTDSFGNETDGCLKSINLSFSYFSAF